MNDKDLIKSARIPNTTYPHKADCAWQLADRLEKYMRVTEAARKCKNGCRRCNAFDRYAVLKDALAALDEE